MTARDILDVASVSADEVEEALYALVREGVIYKCMPPDRPGFVSLLDAEGQARPLDEIEAEVIQFAIARYGRMPEVGRRLGIGRSTLYRKVRR